MGHNGWKDISSFSKSDKDRTPKTWELKFAGLRLIVTRHIHYPGSWIASFSPFFERKDFGGLDIDIAKRHAIDHAREYLRNALNELETKAHPGAEV